MMGGHVARMSERKDYRVFVGDASRRNVHLEDLGINGRSIHAFKLMLQE